MKANSIMARDNMISQTVLAAQHRMFRLAERDHALTLKAISMDADIPYNTIRSYSDVNGGTIMPLDAFAKLVGVIPDYLLSHAFDSVGRALVPSSPDVDHDALAAECLAFVSEYGRARHPKSPGGVDIVPIEAAALSAKVPMASKAA